MLRAALALDSDDARALLRRLVEEGWLRYPLRLGEAYRPGIRLEAAERNTETLFANITTGLDVASAPRGLDERILDALTDHGELGVNEIAAYAGSTPNAIRPRLRVLIAQGAIIATAPQQSRRRRYRLGALKG